MRFRSPILWVLGYLCVIDIGIDFFFRYPTDPRNINPSRLQQLFEYGRSTEGKYARMTRSTDETSAPIISVGWLESERNYFLVDDSHRRGKPTVSVFGMSHAGDVADDLVMIDTTIAVRYLGAPGAVVSWAFTAYAMDRGRFHTDIAVLAVMTDGVPFITTTSGESMSWWFPYPYTYPRYFLSDGKLSELRPPFMSVQGFREYLYDPIKWSRYRAWLEHYDKYYDALLFEKSILDNSSIVRLLRRSYANITRRSKAAGVFDGRAFNRGCEEVQLLLAFIVEFARSTRSDGTLPFLYIINNRGSGNSLYQLLEPTLVAHKIPCLNSDEICPAEDPRYYVEDGHFTVAANMALAREMSRLIHEQLEKRRQDS